MIVVRVHCIGINFRNALKSRGLYLHTRIFAQSDEDQPKVNRDTEPGSDFLGTIVRVGLTITNFQVGDHVVDVTGDGTYYSHIMINSQLIIRIPSDFLLTDEQLCGLPCQILTVIYSLKYRVHLQSDQTVLIHAATGAAGQMCIQYCQCTGARVIATAESEEKRRFLREHYGIEHVFNSRDASFVNDIRRILPQGVDVIVNSLSDNLLKESIKLLSYHGHFVEWCKRDIYDKNNLSIGSCITSYSSYMFVEAIDLFAQRKLRAVEPTVTYEPSQVIEALLRCNSGQVMGKTVFRITSSDQPLTINKKQSTAQTDKTSRTTRLKFVNTPFLRIRKMPLTFNILRELFNTAEKVPQKVALVLEDQVWTYGELIEKVNQVVQYLNRFEITQGQIIYQFVERSLEMVCGILGIICAGGVYCSLNPADPLERLISLIDQTQGQFVMLHEKTRNQFPSSAVKKVILYEEIFFLSMNTTKKSKSFACNEAGAAYIICTSGTTGQQKAIIHTHESLSASVDALIHWNVGFYSSQDQVLQIAACSWAMHLLEIFPILVLGGTLVLMRAGGQLNMTYFSRTLFDQQITTLTIGAGMARALINYAEDLDINDNMIPAGYPLPGYRCLLIDEHEEVISYTTLQKCSAIGQICLGGPSVFNCYLNDPQRTATTLITINSEAYIKTGDLGYYNSHGEVVPAGRTDFQIKIRGQRVEAAEIENTIIASLSNEISSCLVMKSTENEERLIAYLVSKNLDINIESIRKYCNTHLRQYMIPSHFVVLDSFPVNTNGKIDRKRLPPPSPLSSCTSTKLTETYEEQPVSELEEKVHRFWCTLLHLDAISRDANCFALGGSSLSIMQLFNYYQVYLAPHKQLNVLDFIVNPTIVEHVRHLKDPEMKTFTHWNALNLVQGM
ncbi:unnamed protein product [Adineta steineri]|uniref:Carrier domain-containing protein n=1 Tax=Adineta steineri TaxID=433720 RepID=A0A816ARU4_9BILA|nr:unnamed protein product [Adineta steineri]CAF1599959.1 unnamed protein product [Adineta steineri]